MIPEDNYVISFLKVELAEKSMNMSVETVEAYDGEISSEYSDCSSMARNGLCWKIQSLLISFCMKVRWFKGRANECSSKNSTIGISVGLFWNCAWYCLHTRASAFTLTK